MTTTLQTNTRPPTPAAPTRGLDAHLYLLLLLAALILMSPLTASAGPGHDHGNEPAAPAGAALPRFSATSELFELVGVLNGKQLTLYLDHSATNAPVKDATLDFEWGGAKVKTEAHGDGEFVVMLAEAPKPGVIAISAMVTAGPDSDLLAGELDLHAGTTDSNGHNELVHLLPWAGALIALALVAAWIIKRRRNRRAGEST